MRYTMKLKLVIICLFFSLSASAQNDIYIDKSGTMRWTGSNEEASFYGVNYTLPFAHAYRAIRYTNKNHKEAIDKDVYHFARLGFNAYRIHVWDVEISDGEGKLIKNNHLDLLDYLIAKLRERNIYVLITTMTNFGNGYPEKNINTGGFSYLYDKCKVHEDEKAIKAQENYIGNFINHINPYTGLSYKDDPCIVGFEINNEPCHAGTPEQTENYINRMLKAIGKTGNKKPTFYNVSHNMDHTQAYFNTAVQGTTYQWYPIGLVAGHTRQGNFLPYVDSYNIPFGNIKGFANKAKAVYEFDPADVIYSYMYPAMARTFRSQGFQWITQFAYDPIDIAWANTEYQTHFLNLAYTPEKAISMAIAAEVAYNTPMNKKYEKYPNDTIFENFRVSYKEDLSELNGSDRFYYSNSTITKPTNLDNLKKIIGYGNSAVIEYEGTGAYFLDKLEEGIWRLEVMPDAVCISDPFEKTSLKKEVVTIAWNMWKMKVELPGLDKNFTVTAINKGNTYNEVSSGTNIFIRPGVYLLQKAGYTPTGNWQTETRWNNITLGEFVSPEARAKTFSVVHTPAKIAEAHQPLQVQAQIVGPVFPDSVLIYTDKISFWSEVNPYIKMKHSNGYIYTAEFPAKAINEGILRYNIVVCYGSKKFTSPTNVEGSPLDWDYYQTKYWETKIVNKESGIELVKIIDEYSGLDTYGIPESSYISRTIKESMDGKSLNFKFIKKDSNALFFWRKYIKNYIIRREEALKKAQYLCLNIGNINAIKQLRIGFVTTDGFTYTSKFVIEKDQKRYRIPLSDLEQSRTVLLPAPYPVFLDRYFSPDVQNPFNIENIEILELSTADSPTEEASLELEKIWIE